MNIVIPAVGLGQRFIDSGFILPKPLIEVKEKTIIEHAIESFSIDGNYIFIIRKSNFSDFLKETINKIKPKSKIIEIDYLTEGSVSSILLAKDFINTEEELITTNCDQRTDWDYTSFLNTCRKDNIDGCVAVYPYKNIILNEKSPYSFIKVDSKNIALQFEEKYAISNLALCGIHYWRKGKDFVESAEQMIKNNDRINNEFYVSKTYNYLIKKNKKITYHMLKEREFFCLGTPQDVENFKNENL